MKLLLDDKYAPLTKSIGFIQRPANEVVEAYVAWMGPLMATKINYLTGRPAPQQLDVQHRHDGFEGLMKSLLPLSSVESRRQIFVQTRGEWTAFFGNGWRGEDVASPISVLCLRMKCHGVSICHVPHSLSSQTGDEAGQYGATSFELFGPEPSPILNNLRSVFCVYDTRWRFEESGEPLRFEELDVYQTLYCCRKPMLL